MSRLKGESREPRQYHLHHNSGKDRCCFCGEPAEGGTHYQAGEDLITFRCCQFPHTCWHVAQAKIQFEIIKREPERVEIN